MRTSRKLVPLILGGVLIFSLIAAFAYTQPPSALAADTLPDKSAVLSAMRLVNDYWMNGHANPGDNGWARAAYFEGNMAMYATDPDPKYLSYSLAWANQNGWHLIGGTTTRNADNQCAGQTYIELYQIDPRPERIADITASINAMVNSSGNGDWSWVDALQMSMPVFAKLGALYNDPAYFDKMYALYNDTKVNRQLYNAADGLWYRDGSFLPPRTTPNGLPIYWSRGNGWAIAAHVRSLQVLPANDPHRSEYIATLQQMAEALRGVQRADGFWNSSLVDPNHYGGPETSGTAFFTYGIAWGINQGLLDPAVYTPVVARAWNGMVSTAVHPDGFLGYVQAVGAAPGPSSYTSTADYGVGAFLLAGSEVIKLADGTPIPTTPPPTTPPPTTPPPTDNLALNKPVTFSNQQAGNEAAKAVDGNTTTRWAGSPWPQWIRVDLGAVYTINRTEVMPYANRAYQYRVEVSTDGTTYATAVDRTTNTTGGATLVDSFSPVPARYVRLTVTGASGYTGGWVSIYEFRVYGAPPPTTPPPTTPPPTTPPPTTPPPGGNLALNKPVTFSNQQAGNEAAKAVDGNTTTRWAGSPWPQWIRVDLGAVYTINRTEMMPYANRAYQYRVEVSTDGTTYATAVDRTTNTTGGATLVDSFSPVPARYVRLTVTGASGYTGGWVSLYEFRIYGS